MVVIPHATLTFTRHGEDHNTYPAQECSPDHFQTTVRGFQCHLASTALISTAEVCQDREGKERDLQKGSYAL